MALINCPECSKEISDVASSCIHCGYPLGLTQEELMRFEQLYSEEEEEEEEEELLYDNEEFLCCPNCYGNNLTPVKKGFSLGKATMGVLTLGMYGILAGSLGSNNIELFCGGCGNKFKSDKAIKLTKSQQKYFKKKGI
jgi:hypothetical protein